MAHQAPDGILRLMMIKTAKLMGKRNVEQDQTSGFDRPRQNKTRAEMTYINKPGPFNPLVFGTLSKADANRERQRNAASPSCGLFSLLQEALLDCAEAVGGEAGTPV